MARTTPEDISAILDNTSLTDAELQVFIEAASSMIDSVFDTTTSSALLKEIERWLAAHLVAMSRERTTTEEGVEFARVRYSGRFGKGLEATPYGQTVLDLDITGKMKTLGKREATLIAVQSFSD